MVVIITVLRRVDVGRNRSLLVVTDCLAESSCQRNDTFIVHCGMSCTHQCCQPRRGQHPNENACSSSTMWRSTAGQWACSGHGVLVQIQFKCVSVHFCRFTCRFLCTGTQWSRAAFVSTSTPVISLICCVKGSVLVLMTFCIILVLHSLEGEPIYTNWAR